jgi:hypothetical protein
VDYVKDMATWGYDDLRDAVARCTPGPPEPTP